MYFLLQGPPHAMALSGLIILARGGGGESAYERGGDARRLA